jgi:protein involved in polysaccharide export with SLBB domain
MISRRSLCGLVPALALAACASALARERIRDRAPEIVFDPWTASDDEYRLGPGDELQLRFAVNPDLNQAVTIGPDGRGVFPLVGPVRVSGLTVLDADQALTSAYASALRRPEVEVLIATYGSAQIFVGGDVRDPGVKSIKGRWTIAQAITAAGGFLETARSGRVVILRQGPDDPRPRMKVVDVRGVLAGHGGESSAVRVQAGDVIFVPRTAIGEVNVFVRQYVTNLIPFGFSYSLPVK